MSPMHTYSKRAPTLEAARLDTLASCGIVDTPSEPAFDAVVRLAQRMFDVPIALISLVTDTRQWFKARAGLDVPETPRDIAFCSYTIMSQNVLVVPDATLDPHFANNPLVTGAPYIRFYAGAPIAIQGQTLLGTVCIIDTKPRQLDEAQQKNLADLAAITSGLIEYRAGFGQS